MSNIIILHILFSFTVITTESSVNLALYKPAYQSSNYLNTPWTADKAVDGDARSNEPLEIHNACSATASDPTITTVWWYVDLLTISRVLIVKILYRPISIHRLAGYSLFISNNSWTKDRVVCFKDNGKHQLPVNQTLNCNVTGRYVTIYNERERPIPGNRSTYAILELCEVEVFGCPLGRYGDGNCNKYCPVGCKNGDCDPHNGICVFGCLDGYVNQECDECAPDRYGLQCKSSCSSGCLSIPCDKLSGSCNGLCKDRWAGLKCDACIDGIYGNGCDQNCSIGCNHTTCNKIDGACVCKKGWAGNQCYQCQTGLYGNMCELECSLDCPDKTCNKVDGTCEVPKLNPNAGDDFNIIGAAVGGGVGVVLLIAGIIIVIVVCRRRGRSPTLRTKDRSRNEHTYDTASHPPTESQYMEIGAYLTAAPSNVQGGNVYENPVKTDNL